MRLLLVLMLLVNVDRIHAAVQPSFDCSKATAPVEKRVCASEWLSALDAELARVYADALKSASDPSAVKKAQQKWLAETRKDSEYESSVAIDYLRRIYALKEDPKVRAKHFGSQKPPASIFGRYSQESEACTIDDEEEDGGYDCKGKKAEDYLTVKRGKGNAVVVDGEMYFFNGHMCGVDKAQAEWVDGMLRVPLIDEELDIGCVLLLRFKDGGVSFEDPVGYCRGVYCGARGSFHEMSLPKTK